MQLTNIKLIHCWEVLLLILLLSACTAQEDDGMEDNNLTNGEIIFSSAVGTKGVDITNDTFDNFGIFTFYTGTSNWNPNSSTPNYLHNKKVSRYKAGNSWSAWDYSPATYWPKLGEKLSFFAYAPHATVDNQIQISGSSLAGIPTLTYQVPNIIAKQEDILYAEPLLNQQKSNNPVRLHFKHSLTKLVFHAKLALGTELAVGERLKVSSILITSIESKGTLKVSTTTTTNQWQLNGIKSDYELGIETGLSDISLTDQYQTISSTSNSCFLMPQSLVNDPTAKLIINYGIYNAQGELIDNIKTKEYALSSLISSLPLGKAVSFNIQLGVDKPGTIRATVSDWENYTVNGNFSATYLNLSHSKVTAPRNTPIVIYYDTDFEFALLIQYVGTGNYPYDRPTASDGKITFPTNLRRGEYKFSISTGGTDSGINRTILITIT